MTKINWTASSCRLRSYRKGGCTGRVTAKCVNCGANSDLQVCCGTKTYGPKYGDTGDSEVCAPFCVCVDKATCKSRAEKLDKAHNLQKLADWRLGVIEHDGDIYEVIHTCGKAAFYSDTNKLPTGFDWITFLGPHCIGLDGSILLYDENPTCGGCHKKIPIIRDTKLVAKKV